MTTLQATLDKVNSSHAVLAEYLKDHPDQQPTFESNGPLALAQAPAHVNDARHALASAARDLQLLALYPTEAINYSGLEGVGKISLQFIGHFKVVDHVPLEGMISYEDLAKKIPNVPQQRLTRIIRHAMLDHFFCEPKLGYVAHSAMSAGLVKSPSMRAIFSFQVQKAIPMVSVLVQATEKYGKEADKAENAAMSLLLPEGETTNPFESWQNNDPEQLIQFMNVMKASVEGTTIEQIVNGYDWKGLGAGTVVDVGGALGHLGIAIAESAPSLSVVIQDVPGAIALGRSQLPSHLTSRVTFMPHDFYKPNAIKAASVYFFSRIMHDWPDESAAKILGAVVEVMGPESKIVIADKVMPEKAGGGGWEERLMRDYDLMMMLLNGMERTLGQWVKLVERADERLRILRVLKPEGALGSLIEVGWGREDSPMVER